jgi:photosystem II stability/assembly factor-like uncharacterized protein
MIHAKLMLGGFATLASLLVGLQASAAGTAPYSSATISGLNARNIGSATMSGRISAIAGAQDPSGRTLLYIGAASGGVWKSEDGGTIYKPVFDDEPVQSIGAVALDPSNASTVWVGTGESWTRNSVSIGDGVYKSMDGGNTWANMGLPNSERIAKIVVSPKDSNTVFVCAAGKLWSDSADRGLYKTTDGGKNWKLVLPGANLSTGCSSLSMDAANPNVLFAALWDFRRKGWTFRSGGPNAESASGSGLFRSADGGETWTEISAAANAGFAKKPFGRLVVAVAPSKSSRVYAFVESTDSALYVSDDGGKTWQQRDKSSWMVWRPFYFANLTVDPNNPDRLFKTDGALILSDDAGKSFSTVGGFQGMHGDVHDVWVNPSNSQTVVAGDDGGMWYSYNGGTKWWRAGNLPVSQFYHVSVDLADPYHVYGGLQDNGSWIGDTSYPGGITNAQWEAIFGSDGFWAFQDPADDNYIYAEGQGGFAGRVNRHTFETRDIHPLLGDADLVKYKKLRFNWNTPIALSPNERGTIYMGSQFLFRSRDHGQSWERISPDLTTNDPEHQKQEESGGVTIDNSAAEMYETIFSISESPKDGKVIWAGTDDGRLQLTQDGGEHWHDVIANVPGLPKDAWVNWIEASRFDAGTAYAAFDLHTFGDMRPYVYRTRDYGKTWTALASPADPKTVRGYAYVIKEDLQSPNLLFLGTEFGLYISIDGGQRWAQFKGGRIPDVAVRDLAIQPRQNDLVLATHGRGIWIIDDITPLRALSNELLAKDFALVPSRPAVEKLVVNGGGNPTGAAVFVGDNPPDGVGFSYYQRSRHLYGRLKLEILDAKGTVVADLPASKRPGLNRVIWNMLEKPPHVPPAAQLAFSGTQGVRVLPGNYTLRVTNNGAVYTAPLVVSLDPAATFTLADREAQHAAALRVKKLFGNESKLMERITGLRMALAQSAAGLAPSDPLAGKLKSFDDAVDAVRKQIVATTEGGAITGEERLREHTDQLYGAILSWEGKPTQYQQDNIVALEAEFARIHDDFYALTAKSLPPINDALGAQKRGTIQVQPIDENADEDADEGSATAKAARADPDELQNLSALLKTFRLLR